MTDDSAPASVPSSHGDVSTTPHVLYHCCREQLAGTLEPRDSGTFGPGLYLTTSEHAARHAQYGPRIAANIAAGEEGWPEAPEHHGRVYVVDVGHLNFKVLTWDVYLNWCEELSEEIGAATPVARLKLQETLASQGFDGLDIRDQGCAAVVVFPSSIHKLRLRES